MLRFFLWSGALVVLLGAIALSGFAGFEVGVRQIFPFQVLSKVDRKLEQLVFSRISQSSNIETTLIELQLESAIAASNTKIGLVWGGGLTSYYDDVLVLRYAGDVFAASSPETMRKTAIQAPDNNRQAYQEAYGKLGEVWDHGSPEPRGANYLRYNDILFFNSEAWHGLIVSYVEYDTDKRCVTNTLARLEVDRSVTSVDAINAGPDDWEVFFRSTPCLPFKSKGVAMEGHMSGGRMAVGPGSTLFMASADFGFDGIRSNTAPVSQSMDNQYGKMLSIDIVSGASEILTMGLRNMQGIAYTGDGKLFTVEHGMRGGDELNLHIKGQNYGWPVETLGTMYAKQPLPGDTHIGRHDTYQQPVFSWLPSPAISGLMEIRGFHDAWDGDLLAASLKDASLYRIRLDGDRVVYNERIPIGSRIRYVHQHTDGRIVLWTDNYEMIFLTGSDLPNQEKRFDKYLETVDMDDGKIAELKSAVLRCTECHSLSAAASEGAPNLSRIYGDPIAGTSFDGYSDALREKGGQWDDENLTAFIRDPEAFAPGTLMPGSAINDPDIVSGIIDYLRFVDAQK